MYALENTDLFNLLCIPEDSLGADPVNGLYSAPMDYCVTRRAMLLVDPGKDVHHSCQCGKQSTQRFHYGE